MSVFQPPPTYALPILVDDKTGKAIFNPIWLDWFVRFAQGIAASGAGSGTVTSVALSMPSIFNVGGSPVMTAGGFTVSLGTQNANRVWAGPTTGAAAAPTFRALVAADLPAGTGTVTSVAQTVPTEFIIAGSPVTGSGTLAITKATQNANLVWAGPTTGAAAMPTFRSIVQADLPTNIAIGAGTGSSLVLTAGITTLGGAVFHTTSSALTDGAGVSLGTLGTAPAAGNPTKWIGINDNGTTRYVPSW